MIGIDLHKPGRLADKIAVITGSSSGIGQAIALAFVAKGASLTTLQKATSLGAKAIFVKCDASNSAEVQALIQKAVDKFGRIDIMVNNAGICMEMGEHSKRPIWEYEETAFEKTMDVNIKGVFLGTKYASQQMLAQEPGPSMDRAWIINLGSVLGLSGGPGVSGYVTSKYGVLGLTKSAALDCAPHRIHVNALCPGFVATAFIFNIFTPEAAAIKEDLEARYLFKGLGTPQDVARAAVFLAGEDAAWVTGIALPVDGGYSSL